MQIAVTVWQIPDAVETVVCAPDDGWKYHPKYVEQFPDINKLCNVASFCIYIGILLAHPILHNRRIKVNIKCLEFCSHNVFVNDSLNSDYIHREHYPFRLCNGEAGRERFCIYCTAWPSVFLPHRKIRFSSPSGCNVKANPEQVWTIAEGSRSLKLPNFKTVGNWRW
jgi:hypothetical protein